MIYLLGGPPRCGKTTLARRLARATGSPWMQTDHLESAFATYTPAGHFPPVKLDPGPGSPTEGRNDAIYARYTAIEIVGYYRALAHHTWTGLRALIDYALFDSEDLILEGFHLDPTDVQRYLESNPDQAGQIQPLFLVRDDLDCTLASVQRGDHKNDWVRTKTQQATTFGRIAAMIVAYSAVIRAEAEAADFPVVPVDGDFNQAIATGLGLLRA